MVVAVYNLCVTLSLYLLITLHGTRSGELIAPLNVNNTIIPLKVDTGSQSNILSRGDYMNLTQRPSLFHRYTELRSYEGDLIAIDGECRLQILFKGVKYNTIFAVVSGHDNQSILGLDTSKRLGLVKTSPEVKTVNIVKNNDCSTWLSRCIWGIGMYPW